MILEVLMLFMLFNTDTSFYQVKFGSLGSLGLQYLFRQRILSIASGHGVINVIERTFFLCDLIAFTEQNQFLEAFYTAFLSDVKVLEAEEK